VIYSASGEAVSNTEQDSLQGVVAVKREAYLVRVVQRGSAARDERHVMNDELQMIGETLIVA
jgi:hypothetical protein